MITLRIIITLILILATTQFYIELEDRNTNRRGNVFGVLKYKPS